MALDIGDKRIGAAFSDPFGIFVSKTELILREKNNDKKALDIIEEYCKYNSYKFAKKDPQACAKERVNSLFQTMP